MNPQVAALKAKVLASRAVRRKLPMGPKRTNLFNQEQALVAQMKALTAVPPKPAKRI